VGCNIVGGKEHASKFGGWTLDNTKANHSAMKELASKEASRKWINVGCIAHSMATTMKDFCSYSPGRGSKPQNFGVKWLSSLNATANMIANYINSSGVSKSLLHSEQRDIYGRIQAIPVSVPTRFATNLFVMRGIMKSRQAFITAVAHLQWPACSNTHASQV
jgi:hypothetical protein